MLSNFERPQYQQDNILTMRNILNIERRKQRLTKTSKETKGNSFKSLIYLNLREAHEYRFPLTPETNGN